MKKKTLLFIILSIWIISMKAQTPGNSLHFDGVNDRVSATLPSVFTNITSNDFTMEAWIKPQGNAFARVIFAQYSASNFASISLSATNQVYFYINNTVGMRTNSTLPSGLWSHVACTWDASMQLMQIYINGVLQTIVSGGTSSTGTNNVMVIGSRTDGNQYFIGELDEIRIWNVIRTQCQIMTAMVSEFTVTQTNLVAYYNFNQGVAGGNNSGITTLPDLTTNYNGTLINFALSGSSSNWVSSAAGINQVNQNSTYNTTDYETACTSFIWINGNIYTTSDSTATYTYTTSLGCDSIITLNLTIITVDTGVTVTDPTLTANATGASYQWLDCNNSFAPIAGETAQSFTATVNGSYAVEIIENGCTDTSACFDIIGVGISENNFAGNLDVYPNPSSGFITINTPRKAAIEILSTAGQIIKTINTTENKTTFDTGDLSSGIYIIKVVADQGILVTKFIKE